jgi:alginate O-acetyltransferase complex protein AlgI
MVFSSPTFIFLFLPIVFLLHLIVPRKMRNLLLLIASLIFYGWGEPVFVLVMILSALVNYALALGIDRDFSKGRVPRRYMVLTVLFNIGMLAVLKYADFLIAAVNGLFGSHLPLTGIPLPIGISFFTFQAMSYVIDVYRKTTPAQKNYWNLLLYISFFPQLIAGPIVRYHDVAGQIQSRTLTVEKTAAGLQRFTVGLAKKVLLANTAGLIADKVFALPNQDLTLAVGWLGALAYLLQIYFDFSGYSDMAIGLGRVFGFEFLENFLYPYAAQSLQDFWCRWHVSLSTWFKEYLYIPLGGNRRGKLRTAANKLAVFFLTGLWHGASWTFVVWGLVHGFFLLLESYRVIPVKRLWRPLRHLYTLLVVLLAFVLFRADTFGQAAAMLRVMFTGLAAASAPASALLHELLTPGNLLLLPLAFILSLPLLPAWRGFAARKQLTLGSPWLAALRAAVAASLFILCLLALSTSGYNPFIYFRF